MMKKIEAMDHYELLEVSPNATTQEIHKAYEQIRRAYEPNSVAIYSLFTPEETSTIRKRIEEAYRTLMNDGSRKQYDATLRNNQPEPLPAAKYPPPPVQPACSLPLDNYFVSGEEPLQIQQSPARPSQKTASQVSYVITEFSGATIKVLREERSLTLRNMADATKIFARYLEHIEAENFDKLPARTYLRGYLRLYANALGFDPERMINDYMKRYDAALSQKPQ